MEKQLMKRVYRHSELKKLNDEVLQGIFSIQGFEPVKKIVNSHSGRGLKVVLEIVTRGKNAQFLRVYVSDDRKLKTTHKIATTKFGKETYFRQEAV